MLDAKERAEIEKAQGEFTDKLNSAIESFRNKDNTIAVSNLIAIHGTLLMAAGYTEALVMAGTEAIQKLQLERGIPCSMAPRLTIDQIYAAYTEGFNQGIVEADLKKAEIKQIANRIVFGVRS